MNSTLSSLTVLVALASTLVACAPETDAEEAGVAETTMGSEQDVEEDAATVELGAPQLRRLDGLTLGGRGALPSTFCPMNLSPVCGDDGRSYPNACVATRRGASVQHPGRCDAELIELPGLPIPEELPGDYLPEEEIELGGAV